MISLSLRLETWYAYSTGQILFRNIYVEKYHCNAQTQRDRETIDAFLAY